MAYGKLNDGVIATYDGGKVIRDGREIFNPSEATLAALGYYPIVEEPATPTEGHYMAATERGELRDGKIYRVYEEREIEAATRHFSKYSFIKCLRAADLFDAFLGLIKSDEYTYQLWLSAEYLDESDDTFKEMREKAKDALGVDDAAIDAFLAKVEEA